MNFAIFVSFATILIKIRAEEEFEGYFKLLVEQSFENGLKTTYTKRGVINIHSLKSGKGDIFHDANLTPEQIAALRRSAREDGIYRIRVSKIGSGNSEPHYVHSFVKACSLLESGLSDKITIHLDGTGNLLGAHLSTTIPFCSPDSHEAIIATKLFDTSVDVQQTVVGPAPETESFIRKLELEKQQAKGQQTDNRSFFAKYWMYIVPLFIFLMVLNNADPGQSGGR